MERKLLNELTNPNSNENKKTSKKLIYDKIRLESSIHKLKYIFITQIMFSAIENEETENLVKEFKISFDRLIDEYLTKIENL